MSQNSVSSTAKEGVLYGIAAYIMWGLAPFYFKQLKHIPAFEILTHRMVWSLFLLLGLLYVTKRLPEFIEGFRSPKRLLILFTASVLLAVNWLIYIWAVNHGRILEASLGYYINPLINVLFGAVFLQERLRPLQHVAVGLVVVGVAALLIGFGSLPWIALSLAISFSTYGLLRKMVSIAPVPGLAVETVFMFPIALVYLFFFASDQSNLVSNTSSQNALLVGLGALTTAPLLCFIAAAKRLTYSSVGFLQYIGPSIMFIIAVTVYDEVFTTQKAIIFGFVWSGVVLFCIDSLRGYKHSRRSRLVS